MNRQRYERYIVERDEDLVLRKVSLGYSPELTCTADRPVGVPMEILPASRRLRRWLLDNWYAHEQDDIRYLLIHTGQGGDWASCDPLAREDLLSSLGRIDFSDAEAVAAFIVEYGLPDSPTNGGPCPAEPPPGHTFVCSRGQVDMVPDELGISPLLIPLWKFEREVAMLHLALWLAKAARTRDAAGAQAVIGPLESLAGLPFRAERVSFSPNAMLYELHGPCWAEPSFGADHGCPGQDRCPRPDGREGWWLVNIRHMFGPCGHRRCLLPDEYLVAAQDRLAGLLEDNPYLLPSRFAAVPCPAPGLVQSVAAQVVLDPAQSGRDERLSWWLARLQGRGPSHTHGEAVTRAPLVDFARVIEGSLAAAWHQVLDLLVHYSELRRCRHCGALFGATHGNQDYCPAPRKGQPSPCQQAAKQARKRAARKAKGQQDTTTRSASRRRPASRPSRNSRRPR